VRCLVRWVSLLKVIFGALFLGALLTGCRGMADQQALVLEAAGKPREALVFNRVTRLRDSFNRGACQSIFDDADPVFRLTRSREAWLEECERLRDRLGSWVIFRTNVIHGPGVPLSVAVHSEAEFAIGRWRTRANVVTVWHFDRGRAELFSLYWDVGPARPMGSWPSDLHKRYLDPPPKREWEPS
jgi:hypothetical protein